ncbi:Prophage CP4-57 regulatory protein (AlpA) [Pseudorhodobacter antarcticus]|uniref:Prophage CP4-57 regulatory protein (AlpA) n=1 Tax=Pseudorhodobacter antarcticus TaxID=1077947 RepID=A0A1H8G1U6_9RHOB|nr:AlpA family phage regulatory protein [Pseudorhodobacter antarcticus]SEN37477.1 Prophage CP4-57 regulatory protein (AlpA) [Pseudorhodobacter antarcticus]
MNDRLLSAGEVIEIIGCGRSTFYKWIKHEKFPQGIKINGMRKWWLSIIMSFINGSSLTDRSSKPNLLTESTPKKRRKLRSKIVKNRD